MCNRFEDRKVKTPYATKLETSSILSKRDFKVGKVAAAVVVYIRYTLGEGCREVPLMTVSEMFTIGQRAARKVVTGKLYDTEG